MSKRDRRERRRNAARRRAEEHVSGFETTVLKMPENLSFFEMKEGVHKVAVVPYEVGKGNPFADEGEEYFERTYYVYRRIGPEEKNYVAIGKTFGKPDPVQEYRQKESKDPNADPDQLKALNPKERQLFLLYDLENPDDGLKLWDVSYHLFGKLLDSRIKNSSEEDGWDLFWFPNEEGMDLKLTVEEVSTGRYKYNEVTAIDFFPRRKPLPEKVVNHGVCLDDLLVELSYDRLKAVFYGADDEDAEPEKDNGQSASDQSDDKGSPEKDEPDPKPKKDSPKKASEAGIDRKDDVLYQGERYTVLKISDDETSLTLSNEDGDIEKAIGVDEVEKVEETPFDNGDDKKEPEPASVSSSKDDDPWDAEWDG